MSSQDQIALEGLRARDQLAIRHLFEMYYAPMMRMARTFVRSIEEAEEVIQDTWVAALVALPRFRGQSSIQTWLFSILKNRARSRGRREARSIPLSQLPIAEQHRLASGENAESLAEQHELQQTVREAIDQLPRRQREVVIMSDVEGRPVTEICSLLELSEGNQRVLLHRARMKLRAALAPRMTGVAFT